MVFIDYLLFIFEIIHKFIEIGDGDDIRKNYHAYLLIIK